MMICINYVTLQRQKTIQNIKQENKAHNFNIWRPRKLAKVNIK